MAQGKSTYLQVRSAYAKQDFEWENLKKLAFKVDSTFFFFSKVKNTSKLDFGVGFVKLFLRSLCIVLWQMVDESNTRLMRDYVEETSHLENEG